VNRVLIECVPNFSEGRDQSVIDRITRPIIDTEGVELLDIDMGYDFNRTVVTMVGEPEAVLKAAIDCTSIAVELIDMRNHTGEHARMGAVDVVPFIPLSGSTMDDCVSLSQRFAEAVSELLGLPVYLYAEAARMEERIRLPDIRRGEYEGMEEKISSDGWEPDYGPAIFNPSMGVTATGARQILIAYNVNLDTKDKKIANSIASMIRTSGALVRDENGDKVIGEDGKPMRTPGAFQSLQAAGWMYDEDTAQVSMNLLDHSVTGLHDVTEAIRIEANNLGHSVTASELVGLVPLNAMVSAGKKYLGDTEGIDEIELVNAAITGLSLDKFGEFDPHTSIIEWAINRGD
jgi:glutamate formiminotransferase/formiminotetrahydrofolate cyclodeaminase